MVSRNTGRAPNKNLPPQIRDAPKNAEPAPSTKPKGRPPKPIPKLDATPEQAARAIFSAVKPPDPSRRIGKAKPPAKRPAS